MCIDIDLDAEAIRNMTSIIYADNSKLYESIEASFCKPMSKDKIDAELQKMHKNKTLYKILEIVQNYESQIR